MIQIMKNTKGTTEAIADWVVSTHYEDIPAKGTEAVKTSFLDWIGCALAGASREPSHIITEYMREEGGASQAHIVGSNVYTTSANAALANGVLGHVDDFDDSGHGGHPAAWLTPTVLALGEELRLSGRQAVTAWAVGYDVNKMIFNGLHCDRPFHDTSLFGTMGAAGAASSLLGLDSLKTRMAFGIAASQASGLMRNFGTMAKCFHPGNAARSGIVAAKLAKRGFTAAPDVIEARYGFADCYGGVKCHVPTATQYLGQVSMIATLPPDIKAWPCCSGNHRPITAVLDFMESHKVKVADIERVEHYGSAVPGDGSLRFLNDVHTGLEGKFSMEYNIAAAFLDGKIDFSTFEDERVNRSDIQSFIKKVHRFQTPEAALHSARTASALAGAHMRVLMKDGTVHELPVGVRRTVKGAAVLDKFRANSAGVLSREAMERVISMVTNLEKLADLRELGEIIAVKDAPSRKVANA